MTLEEISSREIHITWKLSEPATSIQEHNVEVNGRVVGSTRKNETGAIISNLLPGNVYDIRVFTVSAGRFQTPSAPLHVRTANRTSSVSQDESSDTLPTIRAIAPTRSSQILTPPPAPAMTREHSGGQPVSRRGTMGRRPSPASQLADYSQPLPAESGTKGTDDEVDGDLVELSQRFQKVQQDIDAVEGQIQEEDKDFETALKELEARRDELKQSLKERDEVSNDLRKQVHKAETASRTAQNEKTKKERLLQQKENQRRKRKDEMAKWEDQIASMKEEMAGIETQKAAIERRTQSEIREVRQKIEEEQKEVGLLEEDNKEKALQIKALEEERKQLNAEDETDESREADRLEHERNMRWHARFESLQATYTNIWNELQLVNQQCSYTREQISQFEMRRNSSISFTPLAPLDMDAVRRGMRSAARRPPRYAGSGSSVSSPRGPFGPESYHPGAPFASAANASPTAYGPSFFNPQNGMTLVMPSAMPSTTLEEIEPVSSVPMSPRADSLLPADLLGDESADEMQEEAVGAQPSRRSTAAESGIIAPFPKIGSPGLREDTRPTESPSAGSSSGHSFSSPLESFVPVLEADQKSSHSGQQTDDKPSGEDASPANPRKLMSSLFSFNRQRGKTLADQPPLLGSLKPGQSQSFPRNFDDFDPAAQPRRRLSYGGNWASPGGLLQPADDKEHESSRFSSSRRAFPYLIPGLGKSSNATPTYDPFAAMTHSLDPAFRGETSSPRPSSIVSFDKIMPRPSVESQFRAWNVDKPAMRNSPLAPDWGSLHSFSRSQSRRPSVGYGSTSNLSLPHGDEEVIEPDKKPSRPLQAPIGTRPASSQRPATPKLNPAAPSFTMLFSKRGDKTKEKTKPKDAKDSKDKTNEVETVSPPESRKSKDTSSIAATVSTFESRNSLDRISSGTSTNFPAESAPVKPTFISKITRKASSNKFGSWKEKGGLFSRKDTSTPTGDTEEEHGSTEHLGKSVESTSTTPSAEDKKSSRTSLGSWNFMRKSKKGTKEDLTASEISESSERASDIDEEGNDDDA